MTSKRTRRGENKKAKGNSEFLKKKEKELLIFKRVIL